MTDEQAFVAKIVADPKDDLPRLVYADWLDEHGQPERAEFIRTQVRLAELRSEVLALSMYRDAQVDLSLLSMWEGEPITTERRARCEEALRLMRRECELKTCDSFPGWNRDLHNFVPGRSTYRRGFVAEVELTWPHARDHLDAIRKVHPIERVVLTTMPVVPRYFHRADRRYEWWLDARVFVASERRAEAFRGGFEAFTRLAIERLLSLRWPTIEWELPPVPTDLDDYTYLPEPTRDRIEAAVRRRLPVGSQVMWVRDEATPGSAVHEFHHVCPDDPYRGQLPPVGDSIYRRIDVRAVRVRLNAPPLSAQPVGWPPEEIVSVYAGRCPHCRTTFLAEIPPPVPEVPNGRRR